MRLEGFGIRNLLELVKCLTLVERSPRVLLWEGIATESVPSFKGDICWFYLQWQVKELNCKSLTWKAWVGSMSKFKVDSEIAQTGKRGKKAAFLYKTLRCYTFTFPARCQTLVRNEGLVVYLQNPQHYALPSASRGCCPPCTLSSFVISVFSAGCHSIRGHSRGDFCSSVEHERTRCWHLRHIPRELKVNSWAPLRRRSSHGSTGQSLDREHGY